MIDLILIAALIISIAFNGLLYLKFRNKGSDASGNCAGPSNGEQRASHNPDASSGAYSANDAGYNMETGNDDEAEEARVYGKKLTHYASCEGPLTAKTVLIADDIDDNIEVLLEMLDQMGLTDYFLASNGKQALAIAGGEALDLIYMDIQMPIMNGLDAAENIKAIPLHRHTPIIPITAHSRIVTKELCVKSGMFGFLQKPVDMELLRRATRKAMITRKAA